MPFGGAGHLSDQIFHASEAKLWHYAAVLCTLSVIYPLCGLALTNTTDKLAGIVSELSYCSFPRITVTGGINQINNPSEIYTLTYSNTLTCVSKIASR